MITLSRANLALALALLAVALAVPGILGFYGMASHTTSRVDPAASPFAFVAVGGLVVAVVGFGVAVLEYRDPEPGGPSGVTWLALVLTGSLLGVVGSYVMMAAAFAVVRVLAG